MLSKSQKYTIFSLGVGQSFMIMNVKILLLIASIIALNITHSPNLATIPITLSVVGIALGNIIATLCLALVSRKQLHLIGVVLGIIGGIIGVVSVYNHSYARLNICALLIGTYSGFGWFYRYSAADTVPQAYKPKAIALIVFAGVLAAVFGPLLAVGTKHFLFQHEFLATFVSLIILNIIVLLLFSVIQVEFVQHTDTSANLTEPARHWRHLLSQKKFVIGTIVTSICYWIMFQVMVATPLAMTKIYHFSFFQTATAMQLHFLGMYAPGLLANFLLKNLKATWMMLAGVLIYFICTFVLVSGVTITNFYLGLLLLGIGWNFLFVSGSTLITDCYHEKERNFVQGCNNIITSLFGAAGALLAGPLLFHLGWQQLNLWVLPFSTIILATAVIYIWLE